MKSVIGSLVCAVVVLAPAVGSAQDTSPSWGEPSGAPTPRDFVPTPGESEAYIERYKLSVDLEGGGWIGVDLIISNLGFGDGHGAARVRIKLPDRDREYSYSRKLSSGEWTSAQGKLDLSIAGARLRSEDARHFTLDFDDGAGARMKLAFTNVVPMWRPGGGRIEVKGGGYFEYAMLAPRADVTGEVELDGKKREVTSKGRAFADHTATNVAPFDFAKRYGRFRVHDGDVLIAWREIRLEDDYGGESLTWVLVGYKDKVVFSDAGADLRMGRKVRDGHTGYTLPYAVQVDGERGEDSVKLVLRGKKVRREDLLETYGSVARAVAGAVSKPFRYTFTGRYSLQVILDGEPARLHGSGVYSFDFVNP